MIVCLKRIVLIPQNYSQYLTVDLTIYESHYKWNICFSKNKIAHMNWQRRGRSCCNEPGFESHCWRWTSGLQWTKTSPLTGYCVPWFNPLAWCRAGVWGLLRRRHCLLQLCCDKVHPPSHNKWHSWRMTWDFRWCWFHVLSGEKK